ncbi:reverse transcriptase domain-containing protein [Candidatus Amarolinea aalborgensis]|uniref:reverse transcriptase domain-containing protein n=1 Tax=Candidatus Amarolinea aalborgensis TaxID=2249329 RepID=UPI003BF94B60
MFDDLTSWDNLLLAYRRAARGKRGHDNVAAFEYALEDNLLALQAELRTQTYQPGAYVNFYIHEPKRRLISAAPFRDRVVHHALCNLIVPIYERRFIADTYANRVGKGAHRALQRTQQFARRFPYVLQLDVQQFFPSIDHAILSDLLAAKVTDPGVRWLIGRILASGAGVLQEVYDMVYFPGDDLFAVQRPRGLPIGNLTSQFWANVYLDPLDHFITRRLRCPGYVRYVDDLLLFGPDKPTLWAWRAAVIERLARLRLTVHPGAHPRPVTEGIPFLGFVTWPQRRRLKRRKGLYFRRRLRRLAAAYRAGAIPLAQLTARVQGWINHVRFGNTVGLRKAVLKVNLRRR